MSTVVDLGAGTDPDPRADVTTDIVDLDCVDHVFDLEEDWPFEDGEVEGLVARHVLEHVEDVEHVFREAARVLEPNGWFEIRVPLGIDARTDPTHVTVWTYDTPTYFARGSDYSYYFDLPFRLMNREADVWPVTPSKYADFAVRHAVEYGLRTRGPGVWLSGMPFLSGELTATFRRL